MKKRFFLLFVIFFVFNLNSNAQKDLEVTVFASSIQQAPSHDCGDIEKEARSMLVYTIKNERKTEIEIKNIKTPQGFFATSTETIIKAGKKTDIYVIIESKLISTKGEFNEKIIIETNLVENIVLDIKGVLK